jgi:hypothetical protein
MIGASSRLVAHSLSFAHVIQMYVSRITSNPFWNLSKIQYDTEHDDVLRVFHERSFGTILVG